MLSHLVVYLDVDFAGGQFWEGNLFFMTGADPANKTEYDGHGARLIYCQPFCVETELRARKHRIHVQRPWGNLLGRLGTEWSSVPCLTDLPGAIYTELGDVFKSKEVQVLENRKYSFPFYDSDVKLPLVHILIFVISKSEQPYPQPKKHYS